MRNVLLIVHIAAIAVWFGGSIMNGVINAKIAGTNDMSAKATLARSEVNLGTQVYMPVAILTLLTGIGLVVVGDFQFESIWVSFGFLAIIVSAVLGPVKFKPLSEQIAAGYDVELLEGPERVAAREPTLAGGSVIGAVHAPRSAHVEPMEAAVAIADAAVSLGGARLLEDARVTAIRALPAGDGDGERGTVGPSIL